MDTRSPELIDLTGSVLAPPTGPLDAMLTIPEVAGRLGVRDRYVRRLVAERRIPFYKVGYLIRFDAREVDDWLKAGRCAPA